MSGYWYGSLTNLITCSIYRPGPLHKISLQSIRNFLVILLTNRQTDRQTNKQISRYDKHNLLGRDNSSKRNKSVTSALCLSQVETYTKRPNMSQRQHDKTRGSRRPNMSQRQHDKTRGSKRPNMSQRQHDKTRGSRAHIFMGTDTQNTLTRTLFAELADNKPKKLGAEHCLHLAPGRKLVFLLISVLWLCNGVSWCIAGGLWSGEWKRYLTLI